jgi:hypothetical protein
VHRRDDALVLGGQEAQERHEQARRVERVRVVVLGEHAALVEPVGQHVGVDLVGRDLPGARLLLVAAQPGQARAAVHGHPAHDLGGGEVLGIPAHLPDPAVGLAPVLHRALDLVDDDRPDLLGHLVAGLRVQVDRVQQGAPHVVLALVVGAVADAHGLRALVAREVVERLLLQHPLPADAVHDLQVVLGLGDVAMK